MAKNSKKKTEKKAAPKAKAPTSKKVRRMPKRLNTTLYCYVEPVNAKYAREYGTKHFGSFSNYVDALIRADRKESFVAIPVTTSELKAKAEKKPAKKAPKKSKPKKAPKEAPVEPSAPETAPAEPTAPETETTQTEQVA